MSTKTRNPERLCKACGAELPLALWVKCLCGALTHFKIKCNGRKKCRAFGKAICHSDEQEVVKLERKLKKQGIPIVKVALIQN